MNGDPAGRRSDPALWSGVPMELIRRYRFVPLAEEGESLRIAAGSGLDEDREAALEIALGRPLIVERVDDARIDEAVGRNAGSGFLLAEASEALRSEGPGAGEAATAAASETVHVLDPRGAGSPIVRLVDSLLAGAVERRATDMHVETRESEVAFRYRVDGVLRPAMEPVDAAYGRSVVARLKVMAELDVAERRVPQDGRFRAAAGGEDADAGGRRVDFRVSIMPSIHGEDAVVRVLDRRSIGDRFGALSLDVLGFQDRELGILREQVRRPHGMVLVTGPTGSGKTTTLYAALTEILTPGEKIVTIEDPIEYEIEGVTQVPVNERKGLTFARGLRSLLRHDPDRIMVGEVRDPETAAIAVQAALTGHLVLTTVHANDVFDVIGRFFHMGADPRNFVSALRCIVAQRLLRVRCRACGGPVEEELFKGMASGCRNCEGTGYFGRTAVSEILPITPALRELIRSGSLGPALREQAEREGMRSLRRNALELVKQERTTLEEANRVAPPESVDPESEAA